MFAFQIIVILFCLFAVFRVWQKIKTRGIGKRWGSFWLAFWFGVGIIVALPWTTSLLAARLGVTRGVDLVVYVSVIVLFYLVFRLTIKIEKLEGNITKLVREVSLKDLPPSVVIPSPSGCSVSLDKLETLQDEESRS